MKSHDSYETHLDQCRRWNIPPLTKEEYDKRRGIMKRVADARETEKQS